MARGTPTRRKTAREDDGEDDGDYSPTSHRMPSVVTPSATLLRGPVPSTQETSYHKRLRQMLLEHKRCRKEWNELVIRGCVSRSRAVLEIGVEVENGLKTLDRAAASSGPITSKTTRLRAGYILAQSQRLSEQIALIHSVVVSLADLELTLRQISDRAEALLLEAAKTRGQAFAFRDAMWVTWPLSRFVDGLQALTEPYTPSLALIRELVDILTSFPSSMTLTAVSPPPPLSSSRSSPPGVVNSNEHDGTRNGTNHNASTGDQARPSNDHIQAAMSLLAIQPLLPPSKTSDASSEAWEETLAVEVGGYGS